VISVIVPSRGEGPPSLEFVEAIRNAPETELLVAAETSTSPSALEAFRKQGATVLVCDAPRGERLSRAAAQARGEILLFLHADTLLPVGWSRLVTDAIAKGAVAGAFRLAFEGSDRRLRWVAWWANRRTEITRVPYGDQAPFVSTEVYRRIGCHPSWPLMEDVELGRRLKTQGPIALLDAAVLTSPRRYLERGVLRTVMTNWVTIIKFRLGADPKELAEAYRK
jgi:rSAM/selenodomain-associated transferase 2